MQKLLLIVLCAAAMAKTTPAGNNLTPDADIPVWGVENTHMYTFGSLRFEPFTVHPDGGKKTWTVVQFRPYMSPMLYSDTIFFCGDETQRLANLSGKNVVLTYSRAANQQLKDNRIPAVMVCRSLDAVTVIQSANGN